MIMGAFGASAFGLGTMMVAGTITGAGTSLATELTDDIEGVNVLMFWLVDWLD